MADDNRRYQDPDDPENLSSEELTERIEDEKKNARRSIRLAVTALIAIIAVALAWFAANTVVSGRSSSVEAQNDVVFELASVGKRQNAEINMLKNENGNNLLSGGNSGLKYTAYCETVYSNSAYNAGSEKKKFPDNTVLYTGSTSLAWYLNEQIELAPGASGKMEFYLIPKKEGLTSADISLQLLPYENSGNRAFASKSENLKALVDGHILLFASKDTAGGYEGWLETGTNKEASFTVDSGKNAFVKDVPYKITLYWVWPQYLRNYLYKKRSTEGDLFTEHTDDKQYKTFVSAINNTESLGGRLFYDKTKSNIVTAGSNESFDADKISDQLLNTYSEYYNQADEYIGTTAKYVYVELKAN